jgi:hypothetical protein
VIVLTVLPYFMKLPTPVTDLYSLVTVGLSIVILVSSLLQYSSGDVVDAEQHHRSALEINELHRLLFLKEDKVTSAELEDFTSRYNAVLQKYSINHADIDFLQYQLERPEMYPWVGWLGKLSIWSKLAINKHTPSIILGGITLFMMWLVVWYGVAAHIFKAGL